MHAKGNMVHLLLAPSLMKVLFCKEHCTKEEDCMLADVSEGLTKERCWVVQRCAGARAGKASSSPAAPARLLSCAAPTTS